MREEKKRGGESRDVTPTLGPPENIDVLEILPRRGILISSLRKQNREVKETIEFEKLFNLFYFYYIKLIKILKILNLNKYLLELNRKYE